MAGCILILTRRFLILFLFTQAGSAIYNKSSLQVTYSNPINDEGFCGEQPLTIICSLGVTVSLGSVRAPISVCTGESKSISGAVHIFFCFFG